MLQQRLFELETQSGRIRKLLGNPEAPPSMIAGCFTGYLHMSGLVPVQGGDILLDDIPQIGRASCRERV